MKRCSKHAKALFFFTFLLVMLSIGSVSVVAASVYYVRDGSTGTNSGADWQNAYTSLPAVLERGATYYIADGSYGSYTFDDAESSSIYIYIIKATASDHGTDTGWLASYGDNYALFNGWDFSSGYYTIDGQIGGGPENWDSGFGFIVSSSKGKRIIFNDNVSHVVISHTEITNSDNSPNDVNFGSLVYAYRNVTYITFRYSKLHHVFGCIIQTGYPGADNWLVEYSKLGDNTGSSAHHSEIWSLMGNDNITIRYNWLYKWRSTGGIIAMNGPKGRYDDNAISESLSIYGNVFEQGGTTASWVIAAFVNASYDQFARYWTVVNNTFIDVNSTASSVYLCSLDTYGTSGNVFKNNVIYGNSDIMQVNGVGDEDYNSYQGSSTFFIGANDDYLSANPFVDYNSGNYTLVAPMAGTALDSAYNMDMVNIMRGGDGTWDRGAFEFGISGNARPSAPTNLRVVPQ